MEVNQQMEQNPTPNKKRTRIELDGSYWKPVEGKRTRISAATPIGTVNTTTIETPKPQIVEKSKKEPTEKKVKKKYKDKSNRGKTEKEEKLVVDKASKEASIKEQETIKRVRKSSTSKKAYWRPTKTSSSDEASVETKSISEVSAAVKSSTIKSPEKEKKSKEKPKMKKIPLDEALAMDNMEGWSEARKNAYMQIDKNPNMYYYRFNAPGEKQRNGGWTEEEKKLFFDRMAELGIDYHWGIFSMAIPGRVGYQCANFYRKLIKDGIIHDPNYILNDKGEPVYLGKSKKNKKNNKDSKDDENNDDDPLEDQEDIDIMGDGKIPIMVVSSPSKKDKKLLKQTTIFNFQTPQPKSPKSKKKKKATRQTPLTPEEKQQRKEESVRKQKEKKKREKEVKKSREEELIKQLEEEIVGKEVLPRLFLGNKRVAQNEDWLQDKNVKYVLNVTREVGNFFEGSKDIKYMRIGISDHIEEDIVKHFESGFEFIKEGLQDESRSVLVHCSEGRSRSVTMLIAYLIKHEEWDLKKAVSHLATCSNNFGVNDGFKRQLMQFEKSLGRDTSHNFFPGRRSPSNSRPSSPGLNGKSPIPSPNIRRSGQLSNTNISLQEIQLNATSTSSLDVMSVDITSSTPLDSNNNTLESILSEGDSSSQLQDILSEEDLVSSVIDESPSKAVKLPELEITPDKNVIGLLDSTILALPSSQGEVITSTTTTATVTATQASNNLGFVADDQVLNDWLNDLVF